jgi:gamma-glutamyltranspeptidase / glutathione hydrolase
MATQVGLDVLARGGNAADAAAAVGFTLQVVEPHLNGPGGEVPILVSDADGVSVLDGQGVAPAGATLAHYRAEGLEIVPGTGLLAATVPAAFSTWVLLLERWGTWELADVLSPAIAIAERGHPLLPSAARTLATVAAHFRDHWPTSAETWLDADGQAPRAGTRVRSPQLAATYRRILAEAASAPTREARLARAREVFTRGFVAEEIERFATGDPVRDDSGADHRGVLTAADLAAWQPSVERSEHVTYAGWTVHKTSFWGQGPLFLQQLGMLDALDLAGMPAGSADYWHTVLETSKLAFADREAWYGDPRAVDVPRALLDADYARERAGLVGAEASLELRPGSPAGRTPRLPRFPGASAPRAAGVGEPTVQGAGRGTDPVVASDGTTRGDTVHLDVTDASGLTISATPSGGWLQSSPTIPSLGFCLGTRAQMFWLDEASASVLAPGRRPRTTLSPSLAVHEDGSVLAFGTPGGDQQDQWSLGFFLALVHARDASSADASGGVQAALERPMLHHVHAPESFAPRVALPGHVIAEPRIGAAVLDDLRRRGHLVDEVADWTLGRTTAVLRDARDGFVRAGANPRGVQGAAGAR